MKLKIVWDFHVWPASAELPILTVLPCVTRLHCLFHVFTVGFSFLTVLQNLSGFFPKGPTLFWKNKHRHHILIQLTNSFLVWLTTLKQAVAVLYLFVGYYRLLNHLSRHILLNHFNQNYHQTCWKSKKENIEALRQFFIQ